MRKDSLSAEWGVQRCWEWGRDGWRGLFWRGVARMGGNYCHPALKQLMDQQARFAPREERIEQVERAEALLAEIQGERNYPYEYLWYRIKGYRPETAPDLLLEGTGVRHDLR